MWLKKFLIGFPWYLLFWPLLFAININNDYEGAIEIQEIVQQVLWWELLIIALYLFFFLILRRSAYATLLTVWAGILFFYFLPIGEFLRSFAVIRFAGSLPVLLATWTGIAIAAAFLLQKYRPPLNTTMKWLRAVAVVLLLFELVHYTVILTTGKLVNFEKKYRPPIALPQPDTTRVRPDIYYVIFDSYTNNRTLQKYFNYHNAALDSFLVQRGFYVASNSTSNYFFTQESVAGTLNMNYLPMGASPESFYELIYFNGFRLIQGNPLWKFLYSDGYQVRNLSIFPLKDYPSRVRTVNWDFSDENLLSNRTLQNVLIPGLKKRFSKKSTRTQLDRDIDNSIQNLNDIEREIGNELDNDTGQPKFVFVHCAIPHSPYIFDSLGNKVSSVSGDAFNPTGYLNQYLFTGTVIRKMVSNIQQKSGRPALIIIQGDHGYRYFTGAAQQEAGFAIFNAFYFPDGDYAELYPSISSVNTFRVVLNKYFGARLPILKDTSYIPHKWVDW